MSLTEFYGTDGDVDDFALPGDDATLAQLGVDATAEEEQPADKPRNPDGTFAKKDDTPEPEETAVEEPAAEEPVEEPSPPELILGKFKTADELAAAYQELESFKGRQQSEIGELRKALEDRFAAIEQQAARPAQPASWDDLIDSNPAQAAKLAYEHGETLQLQRAVAAWDEVSPGAPGLWVDTIRMRAEMDERLARYDQALAPVQAQATNTQIHEGVARLAAQYPDIGDFIQGEQFADLATQVPLAKKALTEGTPDEVVSALEAVYLIHRGRTSDNLKDTAREVARNAAQEAQTMREEAFVASATATTTAARPSKAEELSAGWDDTDVLFGDNWKV